MSRVLHEESVRDEAARPVPLARRRRRCYRGIVGLVDDALAMLDVERLVLGIPDRSFPSTSDEDTGAGAPDSTGGRRFLSAVRGLGFTGVQLAPQGEGSDGDPSPYDATLFSRGRLALAVARLGEPEWDRLLDRGTIERAVAMRPADDPERVAYAYARAVHRDLLERAYAAWVRRLAEGSSAAGLLRERLQRFRRAAAWWLGADARFETSGDEESIGRYAFSQLVLHEQHAAMREHARRCGLEVWGDLQVGFSERDARNFRTLFLDGYRLGAPPSRTNRDGQPWGYPVLAPDRAAEVERFVYRRLQKTFAEYDGVRIDHPHGLVCPWVYRDGTGNDGAAVRAGARLFDSPAEADHPALARFAIVRPDQLDPDPHALRWADDWVRALDPEQVARYARLVDVIVDIARRAGRGSEALACEILSTCPYPLRRVLERHGLGRFRVTQKADIDDPRDGYRTEHARPEDWVMVGTHDTPPLWQLIATWERAGTLADRAAYLASHLVADERRRPAFARRLAAAPGLLAQAEFADCLASRARRMAIFFTDAFGIRESYNRPGTVGPQNWLRRLAPDWADRYRRGLTADEALNLPCALALALRARPGGEERGALAARLDTEADAWRRGVLPI